MDTSLLESVLDCLGNAVVAVDADGGLVFMNRSAQALLGSGPIDLPIDSRADAFGLYLPDTVTPLPSGSFPIVRSLRGESCDDVDMFVRNPTVPEGRHVSVSSCPWRAPSGDLLGAVAVFHDIHARRRGEEEQRKARLFLDSIIENVPAMIFVKEASELRFERFNRAGEELLGVARSLLIGKNDYDFFPKEQADHFQARDRETLKGGKLVDIAEEPIDTATGRRWLHTRKVPILDDRGQPKYLLGISEDITEQKKAEEALKKAHEELERRVLERTAELMHANEELRREIQERQKAEEALRRSEEQLRQAQKLEAIGRLAGGVAHDFNNMLTAILNYTEMASDSLPKDAPARADLEQITSAAERSAALTRQLLAFSRQQVMQPVLLDLGVVVLSMEDMLRRIIGEDVHLKVSSPDDLGAVLADPNQMEQVILNLAVNARDAMPNGGKLTIETSNVEMFGPLADVHVSIRPGEYVLLAVSDTGTGMTQETMSRVFEPFFTTKPRGRGTGLGLSTVFGIVKQSGGDISVYSELGHGTTFKIYLPRATGEALIPPDEAEAPPATGSDTVLLVEDEDLVRAAASKILTGRGYEVLAARDAGEAMLQCMTHRGPIHLLLTDVVMPGTNGRELAEHVTRERPGIRVLFMSGYTDDAIVHHGVIDAGVAFLPKPFTPDLLARKVREVLDRKDDPSSGSSEER